MPARNADNANEATEPPCLPVEPTARALAPAYDYIRALVAHWDAEDRERGLLLHREDQAS